MSTASVVWSSLSPAVTTVSPTGLVTAVSNGTTTITATVGSAVGVAPVEVDQAVASLVLEPDSLVLAGPGAAESVTASATDAGGSDVASPALTWSSDDEAVATVSATGLVTAVSVGGAVVVAQAAGGGQTVTESVAVSVVPPVVLGPDDSCSGFPPSATATFADPNLEMAVRGALAIGAQDELTCDLLATLSVLQADDAGISDLAGVQNLRGLTVLHLGLLPSSNAISDLGPLGDLADLESLRLIDNAITDISVVGNLSGLTRLSLGYNAIADISALSDLSELTFLELSENAITDISALSDLTGLTDLHLGLNSITDISQLSGLTALAELSLQANSIVDIGALAGLTDLTSLRLGGNNGIANVSVLAGLSSLTFLTLPYGRTDIDVVGGLTGLTRLWISDSSLTDIGALSGLTALTDLILVRSGVSDVGVLAGLAGLSFLHLDGNAITNVAPLVGLTDLTFLFLGNNPGLANVQPLVDNTGLGAGDTVDLRNTNVSCQAVAALSAKGVTVTSDCP